MTHLSTHMSFLLVIAMCINFSDAQIVTSPLFGTLLGSTTKSAWTSKTIYQFLSVKYAEAPSGSLRFKVDFLEKFLSDMD